MENKIIVTIGRQFGSGGREIGQKLAEMLGIAYYDKELMAMAAKDSGLCEEFFEKADERVSGNLSYAFSLGYSYMGAYAQVAVGHHPVISRKAIVCDGRSLCRLYFT